MSVSGPDGTGKEACMTTERYRILRKLGEGGCGRTYLVRDRKLGKLWAMKEWKPEAEMEDGTGENSGEEEFRILRELDSPCFPRLVEYFWKDGKRYLVMDWVQGQTLEEKLIQDGPFGWREAADCALQLCGAMEELHGGKPAILHLGLKPSNIIPPLYTCIYHTPFSIHRLEPREPDRSRGSLTSQIRLGCLVQLGTSRDVVIHHQQMQLLHALLVVDRRDEHAAGVDAHHGTGRQVGDGDASLTHQLLGLIILMDSAQNHPVSAGSVVQSELQQLLGLLHGLTGQHLHGAEIGLGEGLKVHEIGEQRLDLHLREVDLLLHLLSGSRSGHRGALGLLGHVQRLHGREKFSQQFVHRHIHSNPLFCLLSRTS